MARIDAHQHFWQYNPADYDWIDDRMASLKRDFLPADLEPILHQAGFDGCIAVQARQSLQETQWLLDLACAHPFIRGVVGWVDLRSPDVARQLEQFANDPKMVGVRHVVQNEPDDFLLNDDFRRGVAQLADFGLAYDILIFPRQLPAALKFAAEFPAQRFVLDHIAKPLIGQAIIEPWRAGMHALAQLPNVWCKVSGMVTEARWNDWQQEDFRPYLDLVFEAFTPSRLMIGSDWPVCTVASDYARTMDLVMSYAAQLDPSDRNAVLGQNCTRFYGLDAR